MASKTEDPDLRKLKAFLKVELGDNVIAYRFGDLSDLCKSVVRRLEKVIINEVSRFESLPDLGLETKAHRAFARGTAAITSKVADGSSRPSLTTLGTTTPVHLCSMESLAQVSRRLWRRLPPWPWLLREQPSPFADSSVLQPGRRTALLCSEVSARRSPIAMEAQ
jgi:hypothetical protein